MVEASGKYTLTIGILVAFNVGLMVSLVLSCVLDGAMLCVGDKEAGGKNELNDSVETGEMDHQAPGGQLGDKSESAAEVKVVQAAVNMHPPVMVD